ncbi:hypothetical protein LCGC14_2110350 [marine sediment metagenome]|uniref:Uncharacterized protein n=1 Tax=marine sediment metagenome TaxID=412755 RepID=A0A0F9E7A5_9ZZZZ
MHKPDHSGVDPEIFEGTQEQLAKRLKSAVEAYTLKPEHPDGHLKGIDDEGQTALAVGVTQGNVIIQFGKPLHWLGLPPDEARMLGRSLIAKANEAARQRE